MMVNNSAVKFKKKNLKFAQKDTPAINNLVGVPAVTIAASSNFGVNAEVNLTLNDPVHYKKKIEINWKETPKLSHYDFHVHTNQVYHSFHIFLSDALNFFQFESHFYYLRGKYLNDD